MINRANFTKPWTFSLQDKRLTPEEKDKKRTIRNSEKIFIVVITLIAGATIVFLPFTPLIFLLLSWLFRERNKQKILDKIEEDQEYSRRKIELKENILTFIETIFSKPEKEKDEEDDIKQQFIDFIVSENIETYLGPFKMVKNSTQFELEIKTTCITLEFNYQNQKKKRSSTFSNSNAKWANLKYFKVEDLNECMHSLPSFLTPYVTPKELFSLRTYSDKTASISLVECTTNHENENTSISIKLITEVKSSVT